MYPAQQAPAEPEEAIGAADENIARRSTVGVHRVVEGAPHTIQLTRPDAVVEAIAEILAASAP